VGLPPPSACACRYWPLDTVAGGADEGATEGVPGAQDPAGRVKCPPERRERTTVLLIARRRDKDGKEQKQVQEGKGKTEERRRQQKREL
jgi:hypothetical protein